MTTAKRTFVRDVRPYFTPRNWKALQGADAGIIELPHHVWWAPGGNRFSLTDPTQAAMAYQALVVEGTREDQEALLNPDLLTALWPRLTLPRRVQDLWEEAFPALRQLRV